MTTIYGRRLALKPTERSYGFLTFTLPGKIIDTKVDLRDVHTRLS